VVGAYRFDCVYSNGVVIDVDMEIRARRPVQRTGVAPLTSMYWYSETDRRQAIDWRPEVHDSDGLSLWTGAGERIWRPLVNHERLRVTSFRADRLLGFGLIQRDRNSDHYQDDGVFYNKHPQVEPLGGWGRGAAARGNPRNDEIDNIVAYCAGGSVRAGHPIALAIVFMEQGRAVSAATARVVASYIDLAAPGNPRPDNQKKFVIDFVGDNLNDYGVSDGSTPVVTLRA
jgi:glucans biosynthesis protein